MSSPTAIEYLQNAIFIKKLDAQSGNAAISRMLDRLRAHPRVQDFEQFSADVFDRQQTDPPLLPGGVAFPHARTNGVSSLVMVIATCHQPIPFGEVLIRLIFLVGVPKRAGRDYLELISFIARHLRKEGAIDQLSESEDISSLVAAFANNP
ncbi:MAG: PTS sugar transporter subunit IIA [Verrucomicrobia bacterium]|nr:PTS sugar transporter subunit IIA [Verrucomicrobiota bacterium]